jgi:VIT1/CCC1 family predicted Fe2+/Mn2+ transporter
MDSNTKALEVKLNWLRAAVLGANDGIVSVAGVVIGVAGAGADRTTVLIAGVAAVVAGAVSMGGGEYTSVSAQRDTEIAHGRNPKNLAAHPWQAAWSSLLAFTAGALLPMLAIIGPWQEYRIPITGGAVVLALALTGYWAAAVGKAPKLRSVLRNVMVSILTVSLSYLIGLLLGVTVL